MKGIRSVNHETMEMHMKADSYFNNPDMVKDMEDMGMEVHPVDPFGGYVGTDKSKEGLMETEESIQERFQLRK